VDINYAVLEHLKVMSGIDYVTLWQECNQYTSFIIQKDISPGLTGSENSFQLLFHWQYCIMPLYALLFVPGIKVMESAFVNHRHAVEKVGAFDSLPFQQL